MSNAFCGVLVSPRLTFAGNGPCDGNCQGSKEQALVFLGGLAIRRVLGVSFILAIEVGERDLGWIQICSGSGRTVVAHIGQSALISAASAAIFRSLATAVMSRCYLQYDNRMVVGCCQ